MPVNVRIFVTAALIALPSRTSVLKGLCTDPSIQCCEQRRLALNRGADAHVETNWPWIYR
jgi:hypothetical protein